MDHEDIQARNVCASTKRNRSNYELRPRRQQNDDDTSSQQNDAGTSSQSGMLENQYQMSSSLEIVVYQNPSATSPHPEYSQQQQPDNTQQETYNSVRQRQTRRSRARQPVKKLADCTWYTSTPMPGGPYIPDLLIGYSTHIASAVWVDMDYLERKPHVMQTRDKAHRRWQLPAEEPWAQIVIASGISHVPHILFHTPNASLITAFIERWHPETNTFHMPFGEMTITLHDVNAILGIPITGSPVRGRGYFEDQTLLPYVECKRTNKSAFLLRSIENVCKNQTQGNNEATARGFLWHLLGSSLFPDKSGTHVPLEYFSLLKDLHSVGDYAWGAGMLAFLYHQLGKASRRESKQMTGCLTLLESWILEYFPLFTRPGGNKWRPGRPRAERWADLKMRLSEPTQLLVCRNQLDQMSAEDVIWTPYGPVSMIPPVSYYHGCISFLGVNEAYMPDRVARQFGRIQQIPAAPIKLLVGTELTASARTFNKVYPNSDWAWNNMKFHNVPTVRMGPNAYMAAQTTEDYMGWYLPRTHPKLHNPARGDVGVNTSTMYSASQHRLQPARQTVRNMSKFLQSKQGIDPYLQQQVKDLEYYVGTGGLPGVSPTPIDQWWGQPSSRQNFQSLPLGWHVYPHHVRTENDDQLHSNANDDDVNTNDDDVNDDVNVNDDANDDDDE